MTQEVAKLRRQREISQQTLAELLDVPVQHVSRIEAGQNITLATLERIATALGLGVVVSFAPNAEGPKRPNPSRRQKTKARNAR